MPETASGLGLDLGVGEWVAKRERGGKEKVPVLRISDTLLKSTIGTWNISGHFEQGTPIDFLTFQQYKRATSDGLPVPPAS